ncbi:hypothetical protein KQ302_06535 [Synechococcus sp. CS-602]|uniref:hypothetical protein n=1 Tax=Synechococcaceae TaxID=1890426 RepID=UPI0008FF5AAD|nr:MULTISPECIES: hypothetical protein [Synechococcaceae]MCT4365162.1 hypothetical protein [Candidatus Regnicoccus frigidus MAG-AL1]APD48006.1 hypothetical protein BM449_06745 [Synechococcus sp. SynAce01]MCT0203121.1 hypothetical protein [Synechococcus sp. CS-603]MCT0204757.1 hypothetical protein [Synechococcus sp. CS-602]MCT0246178.1 hypothetical protein [Synechococcus sp. CS-601]
MPEEPCQCPDCQRFYREHDRLIREHATLRQQQELNWAALQSFRTLAGRVLEELQKEHGEDESEATAPRSINASGGPAGSGAGAAAPGAAAPASPGSTAADEPDEVQQAIADLENINAHLFSIEALMERIFDVRVPEEVEQKFREVAGELAPDPLNADRLRLNRLLHQTPDLPDRS